MAQPLREIYLSTERMTVWVRVRGHGWGSARIVDAAPIVHGFVGQSIGALLAWLGQQGGLRTCGLTPRAIAHWYAYLAPMYQAHEAQMYSGGWE